MSDFSPETRNSAWWSGDSRKAANGKANEVILTKLGKLPIPDLSDVEAVQMGHVMEPVIGRLAQDRLKIELTKVEESLVHPKHPWFKSHFDFAGKENGKTVLVEAKNYSAAVRGKFDGSVIPPADMAQLIHEAAVFGVDKIYLAVLFGGQEFVLFPFDIHDEQKDELIQRMAEHWGRIQAQTPYAPEDVEQAKLMFPVSKDSVKTATGTVEQAAKTLKLIKAEIKALEEREAAFQAALQGYLGDADTLTTVDGEILCTWKSAKASKAFDAKLFQAANPAMYDQFVVEKAGSRRFLVK